MSVDAARLEYTPFPFKIYPCENLVDKDDPNTLHRGFIVSMRVNYQDVMGAPKVVDAAGDLIRKKIPPFNFKCTIYRTNKLLITAPLLEWSDRGNDDEHIRKKYGVDSVLMNALDEHRNAAVSRIGDKTFQTAVKHVILEFPTTVELSGECLLINKRKNKKGVSTGSTESMTLKLEAINFATDVSSKEDTNWERRVIPFTDASGKTQDLEVPVWIQDKKPRVFWRVADVSKDSRKRGKMENDSDSDDAAEGVAAMLAGANVSNS